MFGKYKCSSYVEEHDVIINPKLLLWKSYSTKAIITKNNQKKKKKDIYEPEATEIIQNANRVMGCLQILKVAKK